ncbi:MAG: hypothetical protein ABW133_00280 [Polyangiaceae bacterium]
MQRRVLAPRNARRVSSGAVVFAFLFGTACRREEPPSAIVATLDGAAPPAVPGSPSTSSSSTVTALPAPPSAADSAPPAPPAQEAEHRPDPLNKSRPPASSEDLQERAAHLIDAIAKNDASLADDFFFPKAPFIPLKDVAEPGRYFDQLLATYHRDIATLRGERKDWTGATFVSFELGTPPTWVAPGKEYNKIGYYRTFGGKLRYRVGDKNKEMTVSTIISWDGRWYVTHLSPIRH